jgi:predicted O-methyltransferase YrrM
LVGRRTIVEVGVFEGSTTELLASHSDPGALVFGIDPFPPGRLGFCWGERIARHCNRRHLEAGKVMLVRNCSTSVGDDVPGQVDFVFVDGDHSLQGIANDWSFWSGRLASKGIIALHDTLLSENSPRELGTHTFFEAHIRHDPRFTILAQRDSLTVLERAERA